jgi:hypothetical protein
VKTVFNDYEGRVVPFIEDDDGELLIPVTVAAGSMGLEVNSLRKLIRENTKDFSGLRLRGTSGSSNWGTSGTALGNCNTSGVAIKEFLRANREVFKAKNVRGDMLLLTEDDYLTACVLCRTDVGRESRRNFVKWQKERARRGYVSMEQFQMLASQLAGLQEQVRQLSDPLRQQASAGQTLSLHRHTQDIRNLVN